jgi:hypothetical protein
VRHVVRSERVSPVISLFCSALTGKATIFTAKAIQNLV